MGLHGRIALDCFKISELGRLKGADMKLERIENGYAIFTNGNQIIAHHRWAAIKKMRKYIQTNETCTTIWQSYQTIIPH